MMAAVTITTRRFGPSGSSINKNNVREHMSDVTPKTMRKVLFELYFIKVSIPKFNYIKSYVLPEVLTDNLISIVYTIGFY